RTWHWLQSSTTPTGDGRRRCFRITHPFHPWFGGEFELVNYIQNWGEHRVQFYREGQHLVSVPASWTDLVAEDPVVQLAARRSLFRAVDLIEVARLVKTLQPGSVK